MDIDKLIKLTRLANNNPNENEANLAARKVCKMLEECNWKLNGSSSTSQTKRGPTTWNDVKRSEKAWWKSTYQEYDFNWEKAYREAQERDKKRREERSKEQQKKKEPSDTYYRNNAQFYKRCNVCNRWFPKSKLEQDTYNPEKNEPIFVCRNCAFNESKKYEYKHEKHKENYETPERVLKCKVCGKEVKTRFVGHSSQFTCTNCWYVKT